MKRSLSTWMCVLAVIGCGDKPADTGESGGEEASTAGQSETGTPTTEAAGGTTTGTTGAVGTMAGTTGLTFIVEVDGGNAGNECDNYGQDCPEGQKCAPYANDGSNAWNATKCVMLEAMLGQPGDECTVEGNAVSGFDSCDEGVMCWDVDPNTLMGICVAMCGGTPEAPTCDPDHSCYVSNDGVLNLCLLRCDPLAQDCPGDDVCIQNPQGVGDFACVLDASGEEGQALDPCAYINACDAGLFCANPANAVECDAEATGCCLPFCDLENPAPCPGAGETCLPWFEEGTAPPDLEQVGFCGIMS
jgi:hypothetical protein